MRSREFRRYSAFTFLLLSLGFASAAAADPASPVPRFTDEEIRSGEFVRIKLKDRERFFSHRLGILSAPRSNDQAVDLVDDMKYDTLEAMDRKGLLSSKLDIEPWSDSYWPIYEGLIADRYADNAYPHSGDWKANADWLTTHLGKPSEDPTDFSPAEKYDLLVGDSNWTLTKAMINEGKSYYDADGKVETWMGICHGWSPASFMMERPANAIEVVAADGQTKLQFFPSDIKALASLLWANARTDTRFIGGRCDEKAPKLDANGRPVSPDCLDNNPGTWHLAIVNQIAVSKRSFVMDAAWDYQVWNQPILGYSYTYFNPMTNQPADSLEKAEVALSDFTGDKYARFRGGQARSVVGVRMTVNYLIEESPSHNKTDDVSNDNRSSASYVYDLELDEKGVIVGGEWYSNRHPDFLWVPTPDARATGSGDSQIDRTAPSAKWSAGKPVPAAWREAARASSRMSLPLAHVVEKLIEFAQ